MLTVIVSFTFLTSSDGGVSDEEGGVEFEEAEIDDI
jgi:hypothetical protein